LNYGNNESLTRQRWKIGDERMCSHDLIKIDIHRRGKFGCPRFEFQHLTSPHICDFARLIDQTKLHASFQNNHSSISISRRLEDERRAGDTDRYGIRLELAAARILRHVDQDRSAAELSVVPRLIETEKRVRAQTRDGHIVKGQFRARFIAGPDEIVFVHLIVFRGGPRRRVGRQYVHFANDPRDPRFVFQWIG
jgi:hypothetical protein